jgi:hypothetical protein
VPGALHVTGEHREPQRQELTALQHSLVDRLDRIGGGERLRRLSTLRAQLGQAEHQLVILLGRLCRARQVAQRLVFLVVPPVHIAKREQ